MLYQCWLCFHAAVEFVSRVADVMTTASKGPTKLLTQQLLTWIFFPCAHRIEANLQDMALYFKVGTFEDHHADEAGRLFQRNFYLLSLRLWFRSLCRPGRLFRGGLRLPCLIRSIVRSRLFGHKLLGMCRLQSVLECASEPHSRSPPCC